MSEEFDAPSEPISAAQSSVIQFRYALSWSGSLVDVTTLTRENRYELGPYACVGCGDELIARLGNQRAKHFKHKNSGACSSETRLHRTGKLLLFRQLSQCIENGTPFVLVRGLTEECRWKIGKGNKSCRREVAQKIDLTKYYSIVSLERKIDRFVPDILLSRLDDAANYLFIEIAVTHPCDREKIESGTRIIEIALSQESDLEVFENRELSAGDSRITLHNFKDTIQRDHCGGACPEPDNRPASRTDTGLASELLTVFYVYQSGRARLDALTISEANRMFARDGILYKEVLSSRDLTGDSERRATALFKDKVREARFNGIEVRNCFNCRLHGLNWSEKPPVFCKLKRSAVNCNDAAGCPAYNAFSSMAEADRADIGNAEYLSRSRAGRFNNRSLT